MLFGKKNMLCPVIYENIPLSTPVEDLTFIVFDTETTGFRISTTDRLIELAAVPVKGFTVQEHDKYQTYINPKREISREITELTSISALEVVDAPDSLEAVRGFFEYVKNREAVCLIGHYVGFDLLVLKNELKRRKINLKKIFAIDTLDLISYIAPSLSICGLESYARLFGTRLYERHRALGDALTTAYLFTKILWQLKERGKNSWGELIEATENRNRSFLL